MFLDILFLMLYAGLKYYLHVQHKSTADLTPFLLWLYEIHVVSTVC